MAYALNMADDGRILSVTYPEYAPADAVTVDMLPENPIHEYLYVDGAFIHDPLPKSEEPEPTETLEVRVGNLETETADLNEALNMILNEVVE